MAKKPKVKLIGKNGNAFAILGACRKAAKAAGWNDEQVPSFVKEATGGDYDQLLTTCMEYFDVY